MKENESHKFHNLRNFMALPRISSDFSWSPHHSNFLWYHLMRSFPIRGSSAERDHLQACAGLTALKALHSSNFKTKVIHSCNQN